MARKRDQREGRENAPPDGDLARTVTLLAERVARLEGQLYGDRAVAAQGGSLEGDPQALFAIPHEGSLRVLAALASAPRLALYRAALGGPVTSAELMAAAGLNTTGQLYHHLRELLGVGLLAQEGRDRYVIVRDRLPAACAILSAALGVAQSAMLPTGTTA